jgi:hypothetical protein
MDGRPAGWWPIAHSTVPMSELIRASEGRERRAVVNRGARAAIIIVGVCESCPRLFVRNTGK